MRTGPVPNLGSASEGQKVGAIGSDGRPVSISTCYWPGSGMGECERANASAGSRPEKWFMKLCCLSLCIDREHAAEPPGVSV